MICACVQRWIIPTSFPVPSARQDPRQMALVQAELLRTAIGQCNRISVMICDWITGVCFGRKPGEPLNEMQVKNISCFGSKSNRWTNIIYNLNFSENIGA